MEGVKLVGVDRCVSDLALTCYLAYSWFAHMVLRAWPTARKFFCDCTYLELERVESWRGSSCHCGWNELHRVVITCRRKQEGEIVNNEQVETMSGPTAGQTSANTVPVGLPAPSLGTQPKHLHSQKSQLVRAERDLHRNVSLSLTFGLSSFFIFAHTCTVFSDLAVHCVQYYAILCYCS